MNKVDTRRQNMLQYIKEHKTVTTNELQEVFNIRKATLSEDITALKAQDIPLITPRGYVSIEEDSTTAEYYEQITYDTLRHWLILYILSHNTKPITFEELNKKYRIFNPNTYSEDTLRKDIKKLKDNKYIHYSDKNHTYKLTNKYNHYITPHEDDLMSFCDQYSQQTDANPNDVELKQLHNLARIMLDGFEEHDSFLPNKNYIVHGRRNKFDEATNKAYEKLNDYPYQARKLDISYNTKDKGVMTVKEFSVGLVVYSTEKNRMYLLGELDDKRIIIAVDSIIECKTTEKKNTIYNSKLYRETIFNEMFSVSVDDLEDVEVLFDNTDSIRFKIEVLKTKRPDGNITYNEDSKTFIYKDKIRGMADFASYIRQFSRGALPLKPESLRKSLSDSTQRVIDNYKEVHHFE